MELSELKKISIDWPNQKLTADWKTGKEDLELGAPRAFEVLSQLWLVSGWQAKFPYTFSWFGRPIIQIPEDMWRVQELIFQLKPSCIIETGVAHGGSLVFYASLLKLIGQGGRVIGIDCDIRKPNREAIESHPLFSSIQLIEGDSVDSKTISKIKSQVTSLDTVLVILDSNHSKEHVEKEMESYASFVTPGSYLIVADGIMRDVADMPRANVAWKKNNPLPAIAHFLEKNLNFEAVIPRWPFNESGLTQTPTYWTNGWLRKKL